MDIPHFGFIFFNINIFGEIVTVVQLLIMTQPSYFFSNRTREIPGHFLSQKKNKKEECIILNNLIIANTIN